MNELYIPFLNLSNGEIVEDIYFCGSKEDLQGCLEDGGLTEFVAKDKHGHICTSVWVRSDNIDTVEIDEHYVKKELVKNADDATVIDITGLLDKLCEDVNIPKESESEENGLDIGLLTEGAYAEDDWHYINASALAKQLHDIIQVFYLDDNKMKYTFMSFLPIALDAGEGVAFFLNTCGKNAEYKVVNEAVCDAFSTWLVSKLNAGEEMDDLAEKARTAKYKNMFLEEVFAAAINGIAKIDKA